MRDLSDLSDQLATATARAVSRRRFLRNAGAAALTTSLGVAYVGSRAPRGLASGPNDPCGPSPICITTDCTGTPNNCTTTSPAFCSRRTHDRYTCTTDYNCWNEDYRGTGQGLWRCCDCCCPNYTLNPCSNCGFSSGACICRSRIG